MFNRRLARDILATLEEYNLPSALTDLTSSCGVTVDGAYHGEHYRIDVYLVMVYPNTEIYKVRICRREGIFLREVAIVDYDFLRAWA